MVALIWCVTPLSVRKGGKPICPAQSGEYSHSTIDARFSALLRAGNRPLFGFLSGSWSRLFRPLDGADGTAVLPTPGFSEQIGVWKVKAAAASDSWARLIRREILARGRGQTRVNVFTVGEVTSLFSPGSQVDHPLPPGTELRGYGAIPTREEITVAMNCGERRRTKNRYGEVTVGRDQDIVRDGNRVCPIASNRYLSVVFSQSSPYTCRAHSSSILFPIESNLLRFCGRPLNKISARRSPCPG